VLFDCPDELEWVNTIEIQARESSFGDVVLLHVMDMASISPIDVDPQFKFLRENRKSLIIPGIRARAVVVREDFKTSSTPFASGQLAVVLSNSDVHFVLINDSEGRTPWRRIWIAKWISNRTNKNKARFEGMFATLTLKPGFMLRQLAVITPQD
jgi:hypothetical protein